MTKDKSVDVHAFTQKSLFWESVLILDNVAMMGTICVLLTYSSTYHMVGAILLAGRFEMSIMTLTHQATHNLFHKVPIRIIKALSIPYFFLSSHGYFVFYNLHLHLQHHRANWTLMQCSVFDADWERICNNNTDSDSLTIWSSKTLIADLSFFRSGTPVYMKIALLCKLLIMLKFKNVLKLFLFRSVVATVVSPMLFLKPSKILLLNAIMIIIDPTSWFKHKVHVYPFVYDISSEKELLHPEQLKLGEGVVRSRTVNDSLNSTSRLPMLLSPSYHECYHKIHHMYPRVPVYHYRSLFCALNPTNLPCLDEWYPFHSLLRKKVMEKLPEAERQRIRYLFSGRAATA